LYNRPLYRIILKILNDPSDAEEVVQDTFVKIWQSGAPYQPDLARPFSFIVMIGRRLAIDKLRKKMKKVPLISGEQSNFEIDQIELADERTKQEKTREMEWMNEQLCRLTNDQSRAIDLAFRFGYTQKEIAMKLKRPLGTIKSDIRRGLERLREMYFERTDD
jgi:RNA polymerase sigma-70 factor (ECF subfamily)